MFLPLNVSWSEPRQKLGLLSGSPGLVVMGDDSCLKGCVFKSRRRILDGHFDIFHIDLLYRLFCLFEKAKNKQKRGRVPPPQKKLVFLLVLSENIHCTAGLQFIPVWIQSLHIQKTKYFLFWSSPVWLKWWSEYGDPSPNIVFSGLIVFSFTELRNFTFCSQAAH